MPRKPKRLRLSISLSNEDFEDLAKRFNLNADDRVQIKRYAAELLMQHVKQTKENQ